MLGRRPVATMTVLASMDLPLFEVDAKTVIAGLFDRASGDPACMRRMPRRSESVHQVVAQVLVEAAQHLLAAIDQRWSRRRGR